ncbi:unnamed protein product [Auanema sp. JU1783]|nr:unnamed protein product [Auanema sp. JU1783]
MVYALGDTAYDDDTIEDEVIEHHECAANEVWMECSSSEDECGKPPKARIRPCQPGRCQCPSHKGFKRNEKGDCIECT